MSDETKTTTEMVKAPEAGGLANWSDELAKYAKEAAAAEVGGGSFLSFKGGLFFNKTQMKDNRCDVIILDAINVNEHYEGAWDPDAPASPDCYAFGRSEGDKAPHAECANKHHPSSVACPLNQWGSGNKGGKGPAKAADRRAAKEGENGSDNADEFVDSRHVGVHLIGIVVELDELIFPDDFCEVNGEVVGDDYYSDAKEVF